MRSDEAVVGKRVQVDAGHRRHEFRGASGTIRKRYGDPEYTALEVEFGDGRRELFWYHDLKRAADAADKTAFASLKRAGAAKAYWLIVERDSFRINIHTLPGEETLPVFSHKEEAASFLGFGGLKSGWQIRETSVGELASLLLGPYACASRVALDPPSGADGLLSTLVSVGRKEFVDSITQGSPPDAAKKSPGR